MFIVCWGAASCDDHGAAHANAGVHGIYPTLENAKRGMTAFKDEVIADTKKDLDPDNELSFEDLDIQVYGSEAEEYYEIDYTLGTDPCEVYIKIVER